MPQVKIRELVLSVAVELGLCEAESVRAVNRAIRSNVPPRRRVMEVEASALVPAAHRLVARLRAAEESGKVPWDSLMHDLYDLEQSLEPYDMEGALK